MIKTEQKKHEDVAKNWLSFSEDYRERKATTTAKRTPAARAREMGLKHRKLPSDCVMTQQEAKAHVPPNTSLWKVRSPGAWCIRMAAFDTCSRSWAKYGEEGALYLCVRNAWQKWCLFEGIQESDCPMSLG